MEGRRGKTREEKEGGGDGGGDEPDTLAGAASFVGVS